MIRNPHRPGTDRLADDINALEVRVRNHKMNCVCDDCCEQAFLLHQRRAEGWIWRRFFTAHCARRLAPLSERTREGTPAAPTNADTWPLPSCTYGRDLEGVAILAFGERHWCRHVYSASARPPHNDGACLPHVEGWKL